MVCRIASRRRRRCEPLPSRAREFAKQIIRARHGARQARRRDTARSRAGIDALQRQRRTRRDRAAIAKIMGKEFTVIATETRPYLQGARLTAWELAQAGVAVSLIPDCAIAQVMARGEVNAVIVGADRVAQNGDVINKVGTYPLALMAHDYGVPFHALVQDPRSLARGADVPIEERPAAEILMFQGRPLVAAGIGEYCTARYPAFDVTPAALITHLIGFDDLYTPETFRQKYQMKDARRAATMRSPAGTISVDLRCPPKNQYAFLTQCAESGAGASILVPEMRPQLWGARVVAPENCLSATRRLR